MRRTATRRDLALLTVAALALLARDRCAHVVPGGRRVLVGRAAVPVVRRPDRRTATCRTATSGSSTRRARCPPSCCPRSSRSGERPGLRARAERRRARATRGAFAALMTLLLAATVVLHRRRARRARAPRSATPRVALGLVGATPLLLGELALTRFDALPVALTAARVAALLRGRSRLAAVALGARDRREALPAPPAPAPRDLRRAPPRASGRPSSGSRSPRPRSPSSCCRSSRSRPARRGSRSAPSSRAGVQVESLPGTSRSRVGRAADQRRARLARRRRRRGRHRRRAERRRDGQPRAGPRRARRPRRDRGRGRRLARRLASSRSVARPPRARLRARSSRHSSRSGGCCRRSSSCGSSRSSRSSRAGGVGSQARYSRSPSSRRRSGSRTSTATT